MTAGARRKLLVALFDDAASGSVEELAHRTGVGRASASRELRTMQNLGLVVSERQGAREVFRTAKTAAADLLRQLSRSVPVRPVPRQSTRGELRSLGAPLWVPPRHVTEVEATLVAGVKEAHEDPTLATVLPLSFVGAAKRGLDLHRLLELARLAGEKAAVGFFLDVTGVVSKDKRFHEWARAFRDGRRSAERPFFFGESRFTKLLAQKNTPAVARAWGFRMNLPMEAFAEAYGKHRQP